MNKKTMTVRPLLTPVEKKTIREARKILKRLTAKWKKLEDEAYKNKDIGISEAEDKFLAELEPLNIDFDGCNAVIDLEN